MLDEAQKQADAIMREADAKAEQIRRKYWRETEEKTVDSRARSKSAAQLRRRQALLACKQQLISAVLEKALQTADTLPSEQYFTVIVKMAAKAAHTGKGEICFSQKDLDRLPEKFEETLNAALPQGASLTVSQQPVKMKNGFLLSYNGIEENGSFEAVLAARHEELQDKVRSVLFS